MKTTVRRWTRRLAAGLGLLTLIACAAAPNARAADASNPKAIIRTWPARERKTAAALIDLYGRPNQFDRRMLVWFNNGTWKRTIVYRRPLHRSKSGPDKDFLQQTVGYVVPSEKIAALQRFHRGIEVTPSAGELTVTSDSEKTNMLALNLADEIVVGKRSVASARGFFDKTSRLAASGKSSPYLDGIHFEIDNNRYIAPTGADQ